jgi:hypothetical protein
VDKKLELALESICFLLEEKHSAMIKKISDLATTRKIIDSIHPYNSIRAKRAFETANKIYKNSLLHARDMRKAKGIKTPNVGLATARKAKSDMERHLRRFEVFSQPSTISKIKKEL